MVAQHFPLGDMAKLDRSLISGLPLFQGVAGSDLDAILQYARSSRAAQDSAIFGQGEEAHSFFLLLDGHIRVVITTPAGQQIIARYIAAGEIFGIAAALGRTTYPATAVAAVDCVMLVWPNSHWSAMAARYPAFAANTYQTVGSRLQETQARVVEMSTEQVEQRVARALLKLANQTGRKTDEGILIDFPISRQDIAEMTGTTLYTVSRILSAWEAKGLVRSERQKVTLTQPHKLFLLTEGRSDGEN
jgi:CRP/FNR family transcriptional regulator, nitrogen oxide reductase regulator